MLDGVDHALQMIQMLRDYGSIRLKDAAAEVGVAPSTAHRILAMLIYRGFAAQDESKRYIPGPSLGVGPARVARTLQLKSIVAPHLEDLTARIGETSNLLIRVGPHVRFLMSVEGPSLLRVGDRQGTVLSAASSSGGKAILAELGEPLLERLYGGRTAAAGREAISLAQYGSMVRELRAVRVHGFALNLEGTEDGVCALGVSIHGGDGTVIGAITASIPSIRFERALKSGLAREMVMTQTAIDEELALKLPSE